MFYVMILYVVLTLAIGVPLLVLVSAPQRPVCLFLSLTKIPRIAESVQTVLPESHANITTGALVAG